MSFSKVFDPNQNPWSNAPKPEPAEEEDGISILDGRILDTNPADIPISNHHRNTINPSDDTMWSEPHHQPAPPVMRHPLHGLSTHPPFDTTELDQQQTTFFAAGNTTWSSLSGSENCTPTPTFTHTPQDFEHAGFSQDRPAENVFDQRQYHVAQGFTLPASIPMSPQSSQGWMSATSSDIADAQSRTVKSPTLPPTSPRSAQRPDGIRKKNARFEIPKDRNLNTIDGLIKYYSEQGDEAQLKELKQQKRLLRNRQAALDSRQRKKQHTEDLEREKEKTDQYVKDLEEELERLRLTIDDAARQQNSWREQQMHMENCVMTLQMERDEIIRTSTLEAGDLRRQNNILREHLQQLEQEHVALQNSAQLNDFAHFDNLPIDENTSWNDFNFHQNIKADSEHLMPSESQSDFSMGQTSLKQDQQISTKNDYSFSWNTFYMCLLFGAFIASNTTSPSSSSKAPQPKINIPALSEEYRAESANVLKAVLASAPNQNELHQAESIQRRRTSGHVGNNPATIPNSEMPQMAYPGHHSSTNDLNSLHQSLTTLTRAQHEIQAFSLTPAQYASITGMDSAQDQSTPSTSHPNPLQSHTYTQPIHQTPLQKAFASMKKNQDQIDRSLMPQAWDRSAAMMWDQVPEKVVRDFKKMVEEVNNREGGSAKDMAN